jgi:D-lactate dehydrogenase
MKVLVYSAKDFEIPFLQKANNNKHQISFIQQRLTSRTAIKAAGYEAISIFSADDASSNILQKLKDFGVKYIALRSTGHDNINCQTAQKLGIKVANAPNYSSYAIAEHALALLLAINRKLIVSRDQIKQNDFSLDNLVGFNINGKTAGIIGTGRIGKIIAKILNGFGCEILATDLERDKDLMEDYDVNYCDLDILCKKSDIIFLSLPLTPATTGLIDRRLLTEMKDNVILINVARGAIVKTRDVLDALDFNRIGAYGTDVYKNEEGIFFYDHPKEFEIKDKQLLELIDHPRVLITPHQAFATQEALTNIAEITLYNLNCWAGNTTSKNEL